MRGRIIRLIYLLYHIIFYIKNKGNTAQIRLRIASSQASYPSFRPLGGKSSSRSAAPPYPTKPADAGLWRGPQDLFRQKYVCKTLKYTKYSCGFTPFSDAKSLVRLSWRFVRYCPRIIYMGRAETEYLIILLTSGKIKDTPNEGMDGNDIGVERRKHQSGDGML